VEAKIPDAPTLSEELAAVQADNPGWHCWRSDAGVMHATTCKCATPEGSGTTVEAPTPDLLRYAIAVQAYKLGLAA
jgi:hypothetical protein